jgi:hypothetical protein
MRRQPIHHSDMFQNRFREQSIEEVLWKPAQVKTSIRCGADADFSDQNGISSFISFPPDCSSVDRVAACTLLLMFSTINRARWKSSSNVRIWGVLDKHFIDRSRVRCRDVIERDRPKLPRRVIQKLCRLSYPMITGLLKRVKYGSDDWAVLPSFEMIPNQPILPCGERHGVNKKKKLVQAQIGQVEALRIVLRKQIIADLPSFRRPGQGAGSARTVGSDLRWFTEGFDTLERGESTSRLTDPASFVAFMAHPGSRAGSDFGLECT